MRCRSKGRQERVSVCGWTSLPFPPQVSRLPDRLQHHDQEGGERPQKQGQEPAVESASAFRLCQTCIDQGQRKPADCILTGVWVHAKLFRTRRIHGPLQTGLGFRAPAPRQFCSGYPKAKCARLELSCARALGVHDEAGAVVELLGACSCVKGVPGRHESITADGKNGKGHQDQEPHSAIVSAAQ